MLPGPAGSRVGQRGWSSLHHHHSEYRSWLLDLLNGNSAFGLSDHVLAAVIRVTTHPRIFPYPSRLDDALGFTGGLRKHPLSRAVIPGDDHWRLFEVMLRRASARANLVTDAWYAALAVESGCTWVTTDRDFARFPGLRWMHPLDATGPTQNPG